MQNTGSPKSSRAGAGAVRRCGRVTRVDLLTVVLAAMLCWASARRALRAASPTDTSRYRGPFPWPASRGVVWAGNSPSGAAAGNRWARVDGDVLRFTDAGAVSAYADFVRRLIPAPVRTALDVGAMVSAASLAVLKACGRPNQEMVAGNDNQWAPYRDVVNQKR
ncbi:hypothetical protein E2562_032918 [Oryza meyeriana var. granulata]|uniref:Uncharacterized protein n=1 Tax=Oryza meyeriana var. granulata TaxID=110450 RepID=A0A6G1F0X9_9ORYZ|nr:hypothetical protein E2562_032918 [Oryza meyeriana var. granulata]